MIVWGSGGGGGILGPLEARECATCEKQRPFNLILQYRYAHVYWLRWVTSKTYAAACEVCSRGWELKAVEVESNLTTNPIPFMTRYGWAFLVGAIGLMVIVGLLSGN